MATHIDNSQGMSPEQVKEALINLVSKTSQKTVAEGNYDRTILAKIQYCSDTALGQYKIQYQNAYYTAYSLDKNKRYSNGASVYVTVPQNDLSNRLFIQDLASNDNNQRTYLTNLEGDQQFATYGQNWVKSGGTSGLDMSSHWDMPLGREVFYYQYGKPNNKLGLIIDGDMINNVRGGDGYFRLGAEFKTNLPDDRKLQGDYGIRAVLVFKDDAGKEYKETYELSTYLMDGAPFEFTTYAERYNYWAIDKSRFVRVDSISGYVKNFPESSVQPEPIDIFVRNITLYSGIKLYEPTVDYTYNVAIHAPQGFYFNLPIDGEEEITSLRLEGEFTINGVPVDSGNQDVEFFWAKKNLAIDSVGNPKFLKYFGAGWQCLNTGQASRSSDDEISSLKNYTVTSEPDALGYRGVIKWDNNPIITLEKDQCKGRITTIKCCVRYENVTYMSREYQITNTTGYYLLLNSSHGDEPFYNGNGSTDITAGVFRTQLTQNNYQSTPLPNPFVPVQNITFKWAIENNNTTKTLPYSAPSDSLVSEPDWEANKTGLDYSDTVEETDENVDVYLTQLAQLYNIDKVLIQNCYERYNYYSNIWSNEEDHESQTYIVAKRRTDAIISDWSNQLSKYYTESFQNPYNLCVLGPSKVYSKWDVDAAILRQMYESRIDPHDNAVVDHVEHIYNDGTQSYSEYQQNTLYKLQAKDIIQQMKVSVTALLTEDDIVYPLETKDIYLTNIEGSGLKYDLQIMNGNQNYVYSAGGKKPDISLKPLSFKLFAQDGALVFDSASEDNEPGLIETLKPKWKFNTGNTLLLVNYKGIDQCIPDPEVLNRYILQNQPYFYYQLADNYNIDYKERSNVELTVSYEGATYTASTNFTFSKQGDLGTNGTNLILDIQDPKYEQYRSDVLSMDMYSSFNHYNGDNNAIIDYYYPNERHLKQTYLYATAVYLPPEGESTTWRIQESFDDADYCNLRFAQTGSESYTIVDPTNPMHIILNGSTTARLYGYWTEDGAKELVDSTSSWSATDGTLQKQRDQTKSGRAPVYDRSSFNVSPVQGNSTVLTLVPPVGFGDDVTYFYKPFDTLYSKDGTNYEWTAYNVVQCKARKELTEQLDPTTNQPIKRDNFGYYKIPFFYYAYYERPDGQTYRNMTPDGLDPARHFVVYGGYDEVIYGADGVDPQYNKAPFAFRLFDENGIDITEKALSDSKTSIQWNTSYGLRSTPVFSGPVPAYSSYEAGKSLLHKYCTYEGKTYRCIRDHTPDELVQIKTHDGHVLKSYNKDKVAPPYDFVIPYWEEVSPNEAKNERVITPPPTYEACAVDTLFSSWVSIKVIYYEENKKYEAAALLPINILQNVYGSDEINGWDGKKTVVDDGYIISNKIAAGYKDDSNAFIGLTLGTKMITNGAESTASAEDQIECGLFGYGKYTNSNLDVGRVGYGQTLFLDAKTGLAAFGPRGSTQIILNPRIPRNDSSDESWSRLAGWYFSNNYLYKPLYADDLYNNGESSYIDTTNGKMVAVDTHKDYYDIKPPDADGAKIPGSVGIYVPSRDTGKLTPNTVFLWASAAGMRDTSFNDNGSFDALKGVVTNIVSKCNKSQFPLAYNGLTDTTQEITYTLSQGFLIDNINELASAYSDRPTLMTYIGNYQTAFDRFYTAIQYAYPSLKDSLEGVITEIQNLVNSNSFPRVIRNGKEVKPDVSQRFTIANVDELKTWYLESNEASVTSHGSELASLNTKLGTYEDYREILVSNPEEDEDVYYAIGGLGDATSVIKSYMNDVTFVKKTKGVATWDTSTAIKPIVNADQVTIDNMTEMKNKYARPAYLASEESIQYITDLNDLFDSYDELHAAYATWKDNWDASSGKAIGYESSNDDKAQANFSVTYGGKLHCAKAEVEGQITATSGKIGVGNNAIEICVNKVESGDTHAKYYLLWNKAFKVQYDNNTQKSEVFVDGTINARSGKIGNTADSADGNDKHTLFMEYDWYARALPDSHLRWGDTKDQEGHTVRNPQWDVNQPTKYILWNPYFSVIDDPKGSVNYGADGQHVDFTYKAGDACFFGRVYGTGGRIGDWVIDDEEDVLRDPYSTLKLKPNIRGQGREKTGYILSGRTIIWGDGSIDGACQGSDPQSGLPNNPNWWIEADGTAHFNGTNSTYKGSSYTAGSTSVTTTGVSTTGTVSAGTVSGTTGTFSGNVNISGTLSANTYYAGTNIFNSGGISIGNSSITSGTATLGSTTLNGGLNLNGNAIQGATNITASGSITIDSANIRTAAFTSVTSTSYFVGGQPLDAYIESIVNSILANKTINIYGVSGSPSSGTSHTHGPGSYVGRFSS